MVDRGRARATGSLLMILSVAGCSSGGSINGLAPDADAADGKTDRPAIVIPGMADAASDHPIDASGPSTGDRCVQCRSTLGAYCGQIGDGCGGVLECGDCPENQICGVYTPHVCAPAPGTCSPASCAVGQDSYCGVISDGCGSVKDCGSCAGGWTCGGGGTEHLCGASTTSGLCTPTRCTQDGGRYCGVIGSGCGGALDCGDCPAGMACGSAVPHLCTPSPCTATTCSPKGGSYCGTIGDGCGGALDCGGCKNGWTCGGRGIARVCGAPPGVACQALSCASGGYCGTIGDGCGGTLACGGCPAGQSCSPTGICRRPCALCNQIPACATGTTTISGRVLTAALTDPHPVYNAAVFIPNGTLPSLSDGASCERCTAMSASDVVVSAISAADGSFILSDVPAGSGIPIVVQLGHWRRQVTIDVKPCVDNPLPAGTLRLPRNRREGDIPLTAIATGSSDLVECLLRKMGIEDTEFSNPDGAGRIHIYAGSGVALDERSPNSTDLVGASATLLKYHQVLLPCWTLEALNSPELYTPNLMAYANQGGRLFATDLNRTWLWDGGPVQASVQWSDEDLSKLGTVLGTIDTSFPKGAALAQWLQTVGALSNAAPPQITIEHAYQRADRAVPGGGAQPWISTNNPTTLQHLTINMPVKGTAETICGRIIYSAFHVESNQDVVQVRFPRECDMTAMTAQEKVLEFMLLDLASCIKDETTATPPPPVGAPPSPTNPPEPLTPPPSALPVPPPPLPPPPLIP